MGLLRGLITLTLLLSFVTLTFWLFGKRHKQHFDAAARLPLQDEDSSHE